jgi:hypothetical protein
MSSTQGGGRLEAAKGQEISGRGPSTANYEVAAEVGFDLFPEIARSRLFLDGFIGSEPISASCSELTVRRRPDGGHYQVGTAWWGDESRAVLMECQREMEHRGGKRFAPRGDWSVSGVVHHLSGVGGRETSTWSFDSGARRGNDSSPPVLAQDPLDLLPPDVVAPIRGGFSDLWRITSSSSADEYLCAVKLVNGEALLLGATRTSRTNAGLLRAGWVVTTLVASINRSEPFAFVCGDEATNFRGASQIDQTEGAHPLTSG